MLDDQYGYVARQGVEHAQDELRFCRGHAGRRLVQQQHRRAAGECNRDLDQPLLAVRKIRDTAERVIGESERGQYMQAFVTNSRCALAGRHIVRAAPLRSATASATLSSMVRRPNSVLIWKVRPRPRLTRAAWPSRVTSTPPTRSGRRSGREHRSAC